MSETINAEATVKDLVIAAGRMGFAVSTVAPPPWSTRTEVDLDENDPSVQHVHEYRSGKFWGGIEKVILRTDTNTDVTIWWDSFDSTGRSEVLRLEVGISDIPDLIVALQTAHDIVENAPRVMKRPASVDDELQRLDV